MRDRDERTTQGRTGPRSAPRRSRWALPLLAAAVACAVYLDSLGGDFVWDDRPLILDDRAVTSWHRLGDIFTRDFFDRHEDDLPYGYYRPASTLTYLVDLTVWGMRPAGFHLTNVLVHALNSALVVSILLALGWGHLASATAGLLFAAHPMHTENVAWIAGRTDVLAFLFCAFGLRLHLSAIRLPDGDRGRALRGGLAAASFAVGLLAKEMSVVLVGWIAAIHLLARRDDVRRTARACGPYLAVLAAYLVWRFVILDIPVPGAPVAHRLDAAALSAAPTVARYLAWLALPLGHNAYVQNPYVRGLADARLWTSVAGLAALAAVGWRLGRRSRRVRVAAAMLAIAFLPLLNFVRVAAPADMGDAMAERFLYFPSMPFLALVGLGVAAALRRSAAPPAARWVAVAVPVALLGVATISRNRVWRDEPTFFASTLEASPRSGILWGNLAAYHLRRGDLLAAGTAIDHAEATARDSQTVRSARALWELLSGRPENAVALQERIVGGAHRGEATALNNLAYLYRTTGRDRDAQAILERLVRERRAYADVYFNLAEIYRARGETDQARAAYRLALDDRPHALTIANALADLELTEDRPADAERVYEQVLPYHPGDARLLNNLAVVRHERGDTAGALALLARAVESDPAYVQARLNHAQLLQASGRASDALGEARTAARLAAGSDLESTAQAQLAAMQEER